MMLTAIAQIDVVGKELVGVEDGRKEIYGKND